MISRLEAAVRGLTAAQVEEFTRAVRSAPTLPKWPADERYWYSGTAGLKLTREEQIVLRHLWTRMLASLAFAVSAEDVEASVGRKTLVGRLDRLVEPRRRIRIEARAGDVLEGALGGEVWLGVVGIWNALCTVALRRRLDEPLRSDLAYAWRTVIGDDLVR